MSRLLALPREIRDQVSSQLLLSPTGIIRFEWLNKDYSSENLSSHRRFAIYVCRSVGSPMNKHGRGGGSALRFVRLREIKARTRIDLSLLQVCWQLYSECTHLLWGQNIVDLGRPRLTGKYYQGWEVGPRPHVRHIALEYSMTRIPNEDRYPMQSWIIPLTELRSWAQYGSLQSIDFHIMAGGVYALHENYVWLKKKMLLYDESRIVCLEKELSKIWLEQLSKLKTDQYLSTLYIRIIVRTGYASCTRSLLLFRMYHANFDPNLHFKEVSAAAGRELWVDGYLCFDNGVENQGPFSTILRSKAALVDPLESQYTSLP